MVFILFWRYACVTMEVKSDGLDCLLVLLYYLQNVAFLVNLFWMDNSYNPIIVVFCKQLCSFQSFRTMCSCTPCLLTFNEYIDFIQLPNVSDSLVFCIPEKQTIILIKFMCLNKMHKYQTIWTFIQHFKQYIQHIFNS